MTIYTQSCSFKIVEQKNLLKINFEIIRLLIII